MAQALLSVSGFGGNLQGPNWMTPVTTWMIVRIRVEWWGDFGWRREPRSTYRNLEAEHWLAGLRMERPLPASSRNCEGKTIVVENACLLMCEARSVTRGVESSIAWVVHELTACGRVDLDVLAVPPLQEIRSTLGIRRITNPPESRNSHKGPASCTVTASTHSSFRAEGLFATRKCVT